MLQVENVSAGYYGVDVLHQVSFTLKPGEKLAVLGPNGCGKTTLLRTIANVIPYTGTIRIDGMAVEQMRRRELARRVAMLSQITQIFFSYSVFETVMMGRYAHRRLLSGPGADDVAAVEAALAAVHMTAHRDREITALSGGQLQRVFLARIFAQDPEIILLDEPTNHLDLSYQVELIDYLNRWAQGTGRSVIGVLHDINLALLFADRVLLLKAGNVAAYGETSTVAGALADVYDMDIAGYMKRSLAQWERISLQTH